MPEKLQKIIDDLVNKTVRLKDKYVKEYLVADWVCVFAQSKKEYEELKSLVAVVGRQVEDTPAGPIFAFNERPDTKAGKPYLLKIRTPDKTRPERGDMDFNTNYPEFKKKFLNNTHFNLIIREDFEMMELIDPEFDVRVYFSSEPLSKQLGIS